MTQRDHILINTQTTVEITFTLGDATGNVTYTVTDAEGVTVASGNATNEAEAGRYTFVLPPQSQVKWLTIVWTGTWGGASQSITTYAEIVGDYLFTIAEARAFDSAALASTTNYPDATIRAARAGIADFFRDITGVSFIPRYHRETLDGPGCADLYTSQTELRTLLTATMDGTALTVSDVDVYEFGKLYYPAGWGWTRQGVTVSYRYGTVTVPFDIHQAALIYARYVLIASDVGDRTISWSNELGTFRNAIPGVKYPTGIPTVDAALVRWQTVVMA